MVNAQSLTPKTFKDALGKFNELFAGNEQHDAQEFLTFLLGGLSEDLNRIVDKPYIEAPDSDGRPDSELADIWWENHLKREMSIIVALFTGQYKSLLTCKTCSYESARFEPFSTLTVPLPEDDHLMASLILYPLSDGTSPTKYCVRVKSSGNLRDALIELAKVLLTDEGVRFQESLDSDRPESDDDARVDATYVDPIVLRRAQDLAIVDMRNGYIEKIAPISWKLHDIQNKDTGDLPVLHVYELDPLKERPLNDREDDVDESESGLPKARYGFLALAQRRSDVVSRNYVHPLSHRVFGTPLLIRLDEIDACSGRQLYDTVAKHLRNVVPKSALRFLVQNDRGSKGESSRSTHRNGLDTTSRQSNMSCTATDDEQVSAGSVPRYGFRLRVTTRDGRRCLLCPWYRCCIGCQVPDDFGPASVMDGDSIVVDWHFAVDVATSGFGLRANAFDSISSIPSPTRPRAATTIPVKKHSSCGTGKRDTRASGAITLEECLDAFAKEEQIPEAYCSKCKDFRVQTTRMTLWRLPPILVIHLKRFQFTSTMRRKLRDLVVFPIEGLDLSRITAPDGHISKGLGKASKQEASTVGTEASSNTIGGPNSLYDLYAVIHHQGALSGGHYVASIKSETDGQWRLFNDAQIYEIHDRDVVDPSAYILFYIRRDVAKARLTDLWDVREESNLSKEEEEQLVNSKADRCVIS
jgi:ubiquitin C-terminal hydrolase